MTGAVPLRRHGPVALHLLTGILLLAFALQIPCGREECMGPLAAGSAAWVWMATLPFVIVASRSPNRDTRALAWFIWLLCVPLSWAFMLGLYCMYPGLAGT